VRKTRPGSVLTLVKAYGASNGDAGDLYTGLDRFGRVVDQQWVTSDAPNGTSGDTLGTTTEQFQYGYDQDSNALYRNNLVNSAYSELYHANGAGESTAYDPLNRLTSFRRGTLSATAIELMLLWIKQPGASRVAGTAGFRSKLRPTEKTCPMRVRWISRFLETPDPCLPAARYCC
jgi:hypothetical protein